MKKLKLNFLILFFLCSAYSIALGQSYNIVSLDGQRATINLSYKLYSKVLTIACYNDTLFLTDYTGTIGVHVLDKNFLEIEYQTVSGFGSDTKNTVILSIINKKIIPSILVNSYASWFSPDPQDPYKKIDESSLYKATFNLRGNSKGNYNLIAIINDQFTSKSAPKRNHKFTRQFNLKFDPVQNVFYTTYKNMSTAFKMYDIKTDKDISLRLAGNLPTINLGINDYYYQAGFWYRVGTDGYLFNYARK